MSRNYKFHNPEGYIFSALRYSGQPRAQGKHDLLETAGIF